MAFHLGSTVEATRRSAVQVLFTLADPQSQQPGDSEAIAATAVCLGSVSGSASGRSGHWLASAPRRKTAASTAAWRGPGSGWRLGQTAGLLGRLARTRVVEGCGCTHSYSCPWFVVWCALSRTWVWGRGTAKGASDSSTWLFSVPSIRQVWSVTNGIVKSVLY